MTIGRATPNLGSGQRQPGGWIYSVLPYVEQQALHDFGRGTAVEQHGEDGAEHAAAGDAVSPALLPHPPPPDRLSLGAARKAARQCRLAGRRRPQRLRRQRRRYTDRTGPFRSSLVGVGGRRRLERAGPPADGGVDGTPVQLANARTTFAEIARAATGVSYCGSVVRLSDITDGATNTCLLGEKYLRPTTTPTVRTWATTRTLMGDNEDICRWSSENNSLNSAGIPPIPVRRWQTRQAT